MIQSVSTYIIQPIKDFLFVTSCFHCGNSLQDGEKRICLQCWDSMSIVGEDDYTFRVLKERFDSGRSIDDVKTLYYFEKGKLLQSLAHSLKYEEVTAFGYELGIRIAEKLRDIDIDAVIPVPLNKRKERERGYNQSHYIAKGVSDSLKIPMLDSTVHRIKYTTTQTHLNAEQRKENIADAFTVKVPQQIIGKAIAVVDDIITTGSTIQEVARVLKESGASKIIAVSAGLAKLGEDT